MGTGGLVSTLKPLMEKVQGTWVAASTNPLDNEIATQYKNNKIPLTGNNPDFHVEFLTIDSKKYDDYYNAISNSVLWYIHHYIWKPPENEELFNEIYYSWQDGYIPVNKDFAQKIIELDSLSEEKSLVMLQDYHLYLTADFIRYKVDDIFLNQFIHVPWPEADYFAMLPGYMIDSILEGLLANDVVGFHIPRYADNFLKSCEGYADKVDYENSTVYNDGQETMVRSYPISVDTSGLKELSKSSNVKKYEDQIHNIKGENFLIYRTDRSDMSKNIARGFLGYEKFLRDYPEYQGRVKFLVTGKPTRENLDDYKNYRNAIKLLIERINWLYSNPDWKPIEEIFDAPYELVVAAYKNYDCLMVNPICDGMNVVSKEGPLVNETNGGMILSEQAGSYEELKDYVINVDPYDVAGTSEAIYKAVTMNENDKIRNSLCLKNVIENHTINDWISEQFHDVEGKF